MNKRALLAAALVVTAFGTSTAQAYDPDPIIKIVQRLTTVEYNDCSYSVADAACTDSSGAFCTVSVYGRCQVGV